MNTAAQNSTQATVTLDEPIKRGDTFITAVTVRKPKSGALRGVSLIDLANMSVVALQMVLPRITEPTLTTQDIANMDPADLTALGVEVGVFLISKANRLSGSLEQ